MPRPLEKLCPSPPCHAMAFHALHVGLLALERAGRAPALPPDQPAAGNLRSVDGMVAWTQQINWPRTWELGGHPTHNVLHVVRDPRSVHLANLFIHKADADSGGPQVVLSLDPGRGALLSLESRGPDAGLQDLGTSQITEILQALADRHPQ